MAGTAIGQFGITFPDATVQTTAVVATDAAARVLVETTRATAAEGVLTTGAATEVTNRIAGDAATLASAKTYADGLTISGGTTSNTYADSIMATEVAARNTAVATRVANTLLGAASGVATLDASGKLTPTQIPAALVGALQYQSVWNASTNTPTLVSSTGTKGQYYKVSVAGTIAIDGISQWNVGDMIVFNGATWDKIDGLSSEVTSVAGRVGAVTLAQADISGLTTTSSPTFAAVSATTFTGNLVGNVTGTVTGTITGVYSGTITSAQITTGLGFTPYNATNPNNYVTTAVTVTTAAQPNITSVGTLTGLTVTAPIAGSVTGSAASLVTTNFSIVQSGSKLIFKYGATTIASMDSTGSFTSLLNVTAYGTP